MSNVSQWDLFRLPELECFQAMLNRLYRQEAEEVVMAYEAYRLTLQRLIEMKEKASLNSDVQTEN